MTPLEEQQLLGDVERARRNLGSVLDRMEAVKEQRLARGKALTGTQRDLLRGLGDELERMRELLTRDELTDDDRAYLEGVRRQMGWTT